MQARPATFVPQLHDIALREPKRRRVGRADQHFGSLFPRERGGRLSEGRIEKISSWRGRELERVIFVSVLVDRPMIRESWHGAPGAAQSVIGDRRVFPIRLEAKFPVRKAKPAQEMRFLKGGLQVEPPVSFKLGKIAIARFAQRPINDLAWGHREGGMFGPEASGKRGDHFVIGAAALGRVDHFGGKLQMLMAPGGVEVVMLQEHCGGQDDIGVARGIGHELLVDTAEKVLARKAAAHFLLIRRNREGVRILDQHGSNGRAALQRLRVAGQDRADP